MDMRNIDTRNRVSFIFGISLGSLFFMVLDMATPKIDVVAYMVTTIILPIRHMIPIESEALELPVISPFSKIIIFVFTAASVTVFWWIGGKLVDFVWPDHRKNS